MILVSARILPKSMHKAQEIFGELPDGRCRSPMYSRHSTEICQTKISCFRVWQSGTLAIATD